MVHDLSEKTQILKFRLLIYPKQSKILEKFYFDIFNVPKTIKEVKYKVLI